MINLQTKRTIISDHCYENLPTHNTFLSDKTAMYYLQDIATNTIDESIKNFIVKRWNRCLTTVPKIILGKV